MMPFFVMLATFGLLSDGMHKLDQHPIPASGYVEVGLGTICLIALLAMWLLGRVWDE